jgi:hypothetical protein
MILKKIFNKQVRRCFEKILNHLDAYKLGVRLCSVYFKGFHVEYIYRYKDMYLVYLPELEIIIKLDKESWRKAMRKNQIIKGG